MEYLLGEFDGLDECGTHECPSALGFDYMSLLKGLGGAVSGIAEGFGDKKGATTPAAQQALLQAQAEKARAEQSAATAKWVLIGLGGLVAVGGIVFFATRK
jgi:hypothetical protein